MSTQQNVQIQASSRGEIEEEIRQIDSEKAALNSDRNRLEQELRVVKDRALQLEDRRRILNGRIEEIARLEEKARREAAHAKAKEIFSTLSPEVRDALALMAQSESGMVSEAALFPKLNLSVGDSTLGFNMRVLNLFYEDRQKRVLFVGDLVQMTETSLRQFAGRGRTGFGKNSIEHIKGVLKKMGLRLGMTLTEWKPPSP